MAVLQNTMESRGRTQPLGEVGFRREVGVRSIEGGEK